jgi:putative membrane protein
MKEVPDKIRDLVLVVSEPYHTWKVTTLGLRRRIIRITVLKVCYYMKRMFEILIGGITALLFPLAGAGLAQWRNYDQGFGPGMWGWRMMGFMGPFMMAIFWILVVVAIVLVIRWAKGFVGHTSGESALDILKKRYAKGEISKEEFEEKKRDIS